MLPKTKKELLYGVNIKTLSNWLKKKGLNVPRGAIMPADIDKIYQELGIPENTRKRSNYAEIPEISFEFHHVNNNIVMKETNCLSGKTTLQKTKQLQTLRNCKVNFCEGN